MQTDQLIHGIRGVVADTLAYWDEYERRERARISELRAAGCRIVDGGQVDGNNICYTDFETHEVLYHGRDENFWPDGWWHIDAITDAVLESPPEDDHGLPPGLAEAAREWADSGSEEVRRFHEDARSSS